MKDSNLLSSSLKSFKELKKKLLAEEKNKENTEILQKLNAFEKELNSAIKSSNTHQQKDTYHDSFTNLPNKLLFKDRVQEAIGRSKRSGQDIVILYLDIDNFNFINQAFSDKEGDFFLKEIAQRLLDCLRKVDTVSHFNSDEFAILLENQKTKDEHLIVIQKIMKVLGEPFYSKKKECYITVSIGVTTFPDEGNKYDTLIKNAETAMRRAKELGKNTFQHYTPLINSMIERRLKMENKLRQASIKDEFIVYYQPKVSLRTGKIKGMEALVRWRQPDGQMVSPAEFIPLTEEMGLIVKIGEWILQEACRQTKEFHDKGFKDLIVSVNLSPRQIDDPNLLKIIKSVLDTTGINPQLLCLEVTESGMMKDMHKAIDVMNKIKELGIKISLDDFGTGYSSLSHLTKMPVDELKIDRSFVVNVDNQKDDAAITNAIISMAHTLDLKVIAEGVETAQQLDFMKNKGAIDIQGYIFSPPVIGKEFESLLSERYGVN
ncbi:MAG: EAL domain-containing protein [Nitrospinae bacterium]|nr:EAL domain-containing protein [Nitrospinota bacterium]